MCYLGSTRGTKKTLGRPGFTEKISVSLNRSDLRALRKRARRLHKGNLSAAVAEGVRRVCEEEGREALVAWLGDTEEIPEAEQHAIRTEWCGEGKSARSRRRSCAARRAGSWQGLRPYAPAGRYPFSM